MILSHNFGYRCLKHFYQEKVCKHLKTFIEYIYRKLVADKGYTGKNLFRWLFVDGIQLITKLKSNMKGA